MASSEGLKKMVDGVADLLESGCFADLTLKCGSLSWPLHKAIVCPQSEFFMKAYAGDFAKQRAAPSLFPMDSFFYKHDYEVTDVPSDLASVPPLHLHVNILADKYEIGALGILSRERFCGWIQRNWHCAQLPQVVAAVYKESAFHSQLRDECAVVVSKHTQALFGNIRPEIGTSFAASVSEIPGFATDVLKRLAADPYVTRLIPAHECIGCLKCGAIGTLKTADTEGVPACPRCKTLIEMSPASPLI